MKYFDLNLTPDERAAYDRLDVSSQAEFASIKRRMRELVERPVVYGYCRVSTKGQAKDGNSLEAQEEALRAAGATVIYSDAYTGKVMSRPSFDRLMDVVKPGDTIIVTKLDRVARSMVEGSQIIKKLLDSGVFVNVLNLGKVDNSPTGKLIMGVMLCFAEFERDMIEIRTAEGKAIARRNPDYREGRPQKFSDKQIQHALSLLGEYSYSQVCEMTGISVSTLTRARRAKKVC